MRHITLVILAALSVALPALASAHAAPAHAAPASARPGVAPAPVLAHGSVAPHARVAITSTTLLLPAGTPAPKGLAAEAVSAALERGLVAGGAEGLGAERVRQALTNHADLRGCVTASCLARVAALVQAGFTAQVRVRAVKGGFEATALLARGSDGHRVATLTRRCTGCQRAGALDLVAGLGEALGRQALQAARHPASGASAGPRPGTSRRGPRRCRICWITGAALAGAGALATVLGATFWGLDGHVYRSRPDYDRVWSTRDGGITTTALGLSALVAGGALLVYGLLRRRAAPAPRISVGVDPHRRVITVLGRF